METNITYNLDAFKEASKIMSQCVTNLSKENARRQIASMAMQAVLTSSKRNHNLRISDAEIESWAKDSVRIADALIEELNKKKDNGNNRLCEL